MWFRPGVTAVISAVYLSSCAGWQAMPEIQPRAIEKAGTVRVTLKDDRTFLLERPSIVGDRLVGTEKVPAGWQRIQSHLVSLPLADILRVEVERINGGNTLAFLLLGGVMTVVIGVPAMPMP